MRGHIVLLCGLAVLATAVSARARAEQVETVVVTAKMLPLDAVPHLDKTGTPIIDIPRSIQIVPDTLFKAQGATQLSQTLSDVSGASQGGQFNFGFFDRFIIRGLNATFLDDGLPEGTSELTGIVHSLTGVQSVEILKGPGSALYGSAEEGGTINLVHFRPSDAYDAWISEQYGSFDTSTTNLALTGPTGIPGVDGRIDGMFQHSDGFRGLHNQTGEIYGSLSYRPAHHDIELRIEYHNLQFLPDAEGIPFLPPNGTGSPLDVPAEDRYYTPYAFADQQIERIFVSDEWTINSYLVLNLRAADSVRQVDLARNAGGSVALLGGEYALTRRQLRRQSDNLNDALFQAEPTWTFDTGAFHHTLVTGLEAREINAGTVRDTADLPNIANIYHPAVDDGGLASLTFLCDASHNCDNAKLLGQFYGLYAIDQIDLTDQLKVRLSARKDWFETEAAARTSDIPANGGQEEPCNPPQPAACPLLPGNPATRSDSPLSIDGGLVYFLTPGLSVFGGYSSAAYPIFNTEEPESIGQTPELGTEFEAGVRFQQARWFSASSSIYRTTRDNVFTLLEVPNPSGPGVIDIPQVFDYRVQGWETDVTLQPLESWSMLGNISIQSPDITSYPQTPANIGHSVPSVPSLLANFWTTYALPFSITDARPQISFGVSYRNHEFADAANTRFLPGAPLFNAVLGIPYRQWILQAGLSNIFDQRNWVDATGTGGGAMPGPGRTYFVKLTYAP
ncbi:MAG TPA: TonB-dependent receptor [Rhizomicrobium sp.]|jgi:iron complex outermembrane receptor protein